MNEPWHGTSGGYTNHGCRCSACKKAWAAAFQRYMHRHPEQREKQRQRSAAWRREHPAEARAHGATYRRRLAEARRRVQVERVAAALRSWGMSAARSAEAAPFVLDAALGEDT